MSGTVEAPSTETDPFSAAFAHLTVPGDTPAQPVDTSTAPAAQPADTVSGAAPAPEPAAAEPISAELDTIAPEVPEPAAPAAPPDEDILARLGNLLKAAPAAPAPVEQPAPAAETAPAPAEPPIYTKDEETFLTEYQKDWPEVARAEALIRRAEYRAIVGYVFDEVQRALAPLQDTMGTLAARTHLTDLTGAVPDYDTIRDKVIDWVAEQPKYLQTAYQHVITQGTTDEVTDLISRWRAATSAPGTPAAPAAPKKATELPPATMKAAAALAPVGSKQTAPVSSGIDPSDFGAAFEAFAGKA